MSRVRTILVIIFSTVIIFGLCALYFYMNSVHMNDDTTRGNTPGNLYNGGYFCEMDGAVYFRNNYDNGCLYSMTLDESEITQLTTLNVKYISGAGRYLYYYMDSSAMSDTTDAFGSLTVQYGFYRSQLNGSKQRCLAHVRGGAMQLCGSYVYYQEKSANLGTLNKIRIDKTNLNPVSDEFIDPSGLVDGTIYFSGVSNDHALYKMDTLNNDTISKVAGGNIFYPIYQNGCVYYMDGDNDYKVTRLDLTSKEVTVLGQSRADCFNMNDNYIFYANSTDAQPALHALTLDGSSDTAIVYGIYNSINLTSKYIYFIPYDDATRMYHMPVNGSAEASLFNPVGTK